MLAVEQQTPGPQRPFAEERPAANLDFGPVSRPAPASRDPFSPAPLPDSQAPQGSQVAAGAGITKLIRMLDEPARPTTERAAVAPVAPPSASEPGVWTRTFASLASPGEAAEPAAKAQEWTPAQPASPAARQPRELEFPGSANQPAGNAAGAGFGPQGPSEFTRILDASRMRELAMRGGTTAGAESPQPAPAPQQPAPAPFQVQMPSYPLPAAPPAPAMQGLGAMPPPRGYPPPQTPQAPAYPASYAPHAAAMPAAGGGLPQPGMYAPAAPPMPAKPQLPPAKSTESGIGKLQQYVPLLLVMIIVLLVALLVTLVFLMKK